MKSQSTKSEAKVTPLFRLNRMHRITYRFGKLLRIEQLRFMGISPGGTVAVFSHLDPEKKTTGIPLVNIQHSELVVIS
jgi:hypothetical protein